MNEARIWVTRLSLLAGAGLFAYRMASYKSAGPAILGRYATNDLILILAFLLLSAGAAVLACLPALRRFVLEERFRQKMILLAAWLPAWLVLYLPSYLIATDKDSWSAAMGGLFWASTLALLAAGLDAVRAAARRPEFWMVAASVVVALLIAEGGTRYWIRYYVQEEWRRNLYDPAETSLTVPRYQPHHYEVYIPRTDRVSRQGKNRVDSRGFRGEEIQVPKAPGVFRIVGVGGSTTYDTAVKDWREAYLAQLEGILRDRYGYTNVETVNAGVAGHDTFDILVNLEFRVLDVQPDLVIVYENTNDVHARIVPPRAYRGDNSARRRIWNFDAVERATSWSMQIPSALWRYLAINLGWLGATPAISLDNLVAVACTGEHAEEGCLGMTKEEALKANPPVYYERNLRNMVAIARANGAEVLLLTWAHTPHMKDYAARPYYREAFAEQNDVVTRLAQELGTYYYDLAATMPMDDRYWADGRHMTAEGNKVRAELIAAYLDRAGALPKPAPSRANLTSGAKRNRR